LVAICVLHSLLYDFGIYKEAEPKRLKHVINEPHLAIKESELYHIAIKEKKPGLNQQGHLVPNLILQPALSHAQVPG
jgi:hypothetical protein